MSRGEENSRELGDLRTCVLRKIWQPETRRGIIARTSFNQEATEDEANPLLLATNDSGRCGWTSCRDVRTGIKLGLGLGSDQACSVRRWERRKELFQGRLDF